MLPFGKQKSFTIGKIGKHGLAPFVWALVTSKNLLPLYEILNTPLNLKQYNNVSPIEADNLYYNYYTQIWCSDPVWSKYVLDHELDLILYI